MARVWIACPKCKAAYRFDASGAGRAVRCAKCGHVWTPLPAQAAPEGAPQEPAAATSEHGEKEDRLVGQKINSFEILERLGSGGFGVVYRAFDTALERSVALKILPPHLARTSRHRLERFLREARSAAKLNHPNVVTIHEIRPFKDTYYIVMELIDGGSLAAIMAQRGRAFPADEATRIIIAAAQGLGHAHRRGVIHRDIKPGNIMLTTDGEVKVSDFGLARDVMQADEIVRHGLSSGTPHYMAPEQAIGEEPTAASDLYALGVTYYTIIAGRPPYDAHDSRTIIQMHQAAPPPDPRKYVPGLPPAVFGVIEKALAKDPDERYQTAEEMIAALQQIDFSELAGKTVTPEVIGEQIGRITPEEGGSRLSDVMARAARRIQEKSVEQLLAEESQVDEPRQRLWLVVLIIIGAVVFIGGMMVLAFILSG